jgi:hypothetical protein
LRRIEENSRIQEEPPVSRVPHCSILEFLTSRIFEF